jgi:hypothetical protein
MYVPHESRSGNFGKTGTYGSVTLTITQVMQQLIANWASVAPHERSADSDEVFVSEWGDTVTHYANIFQNLTLMLTPAEGECFPDFAAVPIVDDGGLYTTAYEQICPRNPDGGANDMSCATTAQIVANFAAATLNGNGKGSQMSGLGTPIAKNGEDTGVDFGIRGVRWLAAYTASQSPENQIIGGAQFTSSYTGEHQVQCTASEVDAGTCSPEQAEFNVLGTAFYDTMGGAYFDFPVSNQPLNFLEIFDTDYLWAMAHAGHEITVEAQDGGAPFNTSLQGIYDEAYALIGETSQPTVSSALTPWDGAAPTACTPPPPAPCGGPCPPTQICSASSNTCVTPSCPGPDCI